ncbi:MAG TPA: DPP IV N-terminal domain-containing protein [Gemmatimonadales bacterium]|nr:DPP IV N-terminal domain-containing protein [Gemmatimonadales bacterium]
MNPSHRVASASLLTFAALAIAACGDRLAPTEPDQLSAKKGKVKITNLALDSPTLSVGGPGTGFTATLQNAGDSRSNVLLEAEIVQGTTQRPGGSAPVTCAGPNGTLPSGTCTMGSVAAVSNEGPGTGLLVPGEARFVLRVVQAGITLDEHNMGVTLVLSPRIASLTLASTTLVIDDETGTTYDVTVENATGSSQSGILLQGEIVQGDALKGAGGFSTDCPPDHVIGVLPAGNCTMNLTANARNAAGGSGTLVPGAASFRLTLSQTVAEVTTVLDTETVPITLVAPARIAYISLRNGVFDVWTMNPDGTNHSPLTSDPDADVSAAWSPDRTRLAIVRNQQIWVINADGTGLTPLTSGLPHSGPSWSPDGTKIAFVTSETNEGPPSIYLMNPDGSGKTRITFDANAADLGPAWSPDGTRIAFTRNYPDNLHVEVWIMNADGSDPVRISNPLRREAAPAWSPDGNRIAFSTDSIDLLLQPVDRRLMSMNPDGSGRATILQGKAFGPAWSPDGTRIAYFTTDADNVVDQIFSIAPDGTNPTQLTSVGRNSGPAWR